MTLIQFTKNHTDHSTDKGYQFEFFCDRCGNGFRSQFDPSIAGFASGALRTAGSLLGGMFGHVGNSTYEIERIVRGPGHDKAFRDAIQVAKPNFRLCPKCSDWVCLATCWNQKRGLCYECAPNVETELAAAQAQATIGQIQEKVRQQDLTKDIDVTSEATALCPHCGARTEGAKFCSECGKPLRSRNECTRCGTQFEASAKFCPECGNKVG